jgi:hypothetical protein
MSFPFGWLAAQSQQKVICTPVSKSIFLQIGCGPIQKFHAQLKTDEAGSVSGECSQHDGRDTFVESEWSFFGHQFAENVTYSVGVGALGRCEDK